MVAQGLIFTCSSMFQGLGNTKPVLWSSATRVVTYSLPAIWLSTRPGFRIEHVWYLSIAATTLQAGAEPVVAAPRVQEAACVTRQQQDAPKQAAPEPVAPPLREPA